MSDSATLRTVSCRASLAKVFSRHEYWNGWSCIPPGDLPHTGIEPASPAALALLADYWPLSHQGSPYMYMTSSLLITLLMSIYTAFKSWLFQIILQQTLWCIYYFEWVLCFLQINTQEWNAEMHGRNMWQFYF